MRALIRQLNPVAESVIAGLIGIAIGAVIMLVYGYDPVAAYISLFRGSFGSIYSWAESLANATPLILTALTFAVAMRGGLFNIGKNYATNRVGWLRQRRLLLSILKA